MYFVACARTRERAVITPIATKRTSSRTRWNIIVRVARTASLIFVLYLLWLARLRALLDIKAPRLGQFPTDLVVYATSLLEGNAKWRKRSRSARNARVYRPAPPAVDPPTRPACLRTHAVTQFASACVFVHAAPHRTTPRSPALRPL